ncbi:MAG: ABC transporter substrate-binding protein, partial [Rubrobacteraceae bacterium]
LWSRPRAWPSRSARCGVEMPDHTMTWDDFAGVAEEISNNTPDGFYGTEDGSNREPGLECWMRQRGKALFTEGGDLAFERSDLVEWFEYWRDLRESGAAAPADLQATAIGDVQNMLVAQRKAAVDFQNSNQLTAYASVIEDEVGIHMFPQGGGGADPGQYLKPSAFMSVYSRTEYPEESATLIDALVTNIEVASALGAERGIPASSDVREELQPDAPPVEKQIYEYLEFISDKTGPLPPPPPQGAGEISEEILLNISQEIAFGRASIDEGVEQFFSQAENALQ